MGDNQSEDEPFSLRSYVQELTKICKDEFQETQDVEERIRIVCSKRESLAVSQLVNKEGSWPRKDEELSRRNREDGNAAYQEGKYELAILLYTEAMRYAPCNPVLLEGEALALAAANRSAAFFQMKQYQQAIEDIEISVSAGYPANGLYKLYIRQCKCELELGRIIRAQAAFDQAVEAIEWSGLKKQMRSDLTVNLQEAFITLAKQVEADGGPAASRAGPADIDDPAHPLAERERLAVPVRWHVPDPARHARLPSASGAVAVRHESGVGRHVVATRDIAPGEILFLESPIVSTLCDEHFESICVVCLHYTAAPLPCPTCSDASFCSLACRRHALATFHKYECRLTHVFNQTGISNLPLLLMAFRAVSQRSLEQFLEDKDRLTSPDNRFGVDVPYDPSDYATLFNLCTHSERREEYDTFTKTTFACFLLRCLQEVGYFKTRPGLELTSEEAYIGRLLKHFLECIQFNTHTVESVYENRVVGWDMETRLWKTATRCNIGDSLETERIGGGVYPTLALVNHSCDPNFTLVFWGRVAVAIAGRTIAEGEEINDNYGAHYASMGLQERQKFLEKSHWFTCGCKACKANYPEYVRCSKDYKKLPGSAFKYKRCDRQKLNRDVESMKKEIKMNMMKGESEAVWEGFIQWSQLVDSLVYPPHQDFINIRKGIRNCAFLHSPNKCRARESQPGEEEE